MQDDELVELHVPAVDVPGFLARQAAALVDQLRTRFGAGYEVSAEEPLARGGDWQQTIKVRKGAQVGADVDLSWQGGPAKLTTSTASKLGTALLVGIGLPAGAVGAYLGYNHIPPLAFLPGWRIAAALGGVMLLLAGMIVALVLDAALGRGHAAENEQLRRQVADVVRELVGGSAATTASSAAG
jgi:hypothetical protein